MFFLICFAPWQETFADTGDVGGQFGTILGPFWINFKTILGPPYETLFFQPRISFLEMAHTNFYSCIRKIPCQPLT